ncbi:protein NnrT [Sulfitobacter sp. F26169L]|uniref:protein NnrT n=1 Tax=Sulfitobacter sp. F26169L TaxID=2996015 RepID=UPI00226095C0|nr:protein NnrT [Sulfitobacter sp. F26169L]MCX7566156.1 protein NnrT [Sulfitobacter sp. F26169L]
MRYLTPFLMVIASPVWAAGFERPIPQAQSATAEMWFALASIMLIAALALVNYLVMRK